MIKRVKKQKGFTIVELLIVVVVIGILAAITVVAYSGIQTKSKVNRVNIELTSIKKAMLAYKVTTAELPPIGDSWNYDTNPPSCASLNAVESALQTTSTIANAMSKQDPWGSCYGYDDNDCGSGSPIGSATYIKSAGPDKTIGTSDDILVLVSTSTAC